MPDLPPEKKAREQIDAMLTASGWALQDYKAFNPSAARGIALREVPLKSLEESANLPAPEIIAQEITDDLEAALEQFSTIEEDSKRPRR